MGIVGRSIVLWVCVGLATAGVAQGQSAVRSRTLPAAGGAVEEGVQRASCVLQLDFDANRGARMDAAALNALLTSTALVDPAAQASLGLGPEEWPKAAQVELQPAGQYGAKVTVTVSATTGNAAKPGAAKAFLRELASRAKAAVEQGNPQDKTTKDKLDQLEKELAAARSKQASAEAAVRQARIEASTSEYGVRPGLGFSNAERQALDLSLVGQRARLKAIEASLAQGSGKTAEKPGTDAATELVEVRRTALEYVKAQAEAGKKTELDVYEARAKLAEARMAAENAGRRGGAPDGADPSGRWEGEIITLRASIAENEAKLAFLNERAAKASTSPAADLASLSMDEQRARQEVQDLTMQVDNLKRTLRGGGAGTRLTILDGSEPKRQ